MKFDLLFNGHSCPWKQNTPLDVIFDSPLWERLDELMLLIPLEVTLNTLPLEIKVLRC